MRSAASSTPSQKGAWHPTRAGANFDAMKTALAQGEAGGRCARSAFTRIPLRMRAGWVLLLGAAFVLPAQAAALYECNGSHGETVFTSHPSQYHGCKWVSGSRSHPKAAMPKPEPARPVPASLVQSDSASVHKEVKANPAVIRITPLQAPSAPVVSALPSAEGVLPVAKPWPMAVMDAIATNLLPKLLESSPPQPAPASS